MKFQSTPAAGEVAFTGVLRVVTQHDAERAARWFELSQTAPYAARAVQAMAPVWVDALDPPVFFAWVETLTPGETRDAGMRAGFTRWWKNDAESAAAWIQAAELSAAHDPAIDVYAQQISRASPELASEWVYRIHDETLRARAIRPVLRIWLHRDPEALRDWMNANDVPPEVRESIERTPRYQRMERGIEEPQIQRGGRRGEVRPRGQGRRSPTQRAENGSEPDASKGTSP